MGYFVLLIVCSNLLLGAPALTIERQYQQEGGTLFSARPRGDEFLHWIETRKGDILLYSKQRRRFEYAVIQNQELLPSGIPYSPEEDSGNQPTVPGIDRAALYELWQIKRDETGDNR